MFLVCSYILILLNTQHLCAPSKSYAFRIYYRSTDCQITKVLHFSLNSILERLITEIIILEAKNKANTMLSICIYLSKRFLT